MHIKQNCRRVIVCAIAVLSMGILLQTKVFASTEFVTKTIDNQKVLVQYNGNKSKVTIPEGVDMIGSAFEGNKKIKSVILSDSVKIIGEEAFRGCTNLKTIKLSKNLKRIYYGAFIDCKSMKTIKLNKNLKAMDEFVFLRCTKLKKVTVDKGNKHFKTKEGVLYSRNMKKLHLYPIALKKTTEFTIPKSVKLVSAGAFCNNKYLEKIIIKGSIYAGESACSECKALRQVEIEKPQSRGGIEFSDCKKLHTVILAEGTEAIGQSQFEGCKNLVNINFPSSLKYIDKFAFRGCVKLSKPELPDTVEVDRWAF